MRLTRAALAGGLVSLVLLLAGCQTTEPIWFIATPGYVESRIAGSEAAMRREYELEIAELRRRLAEQEAAAAELAELATVIRDVEASNKELQQLAQDVEERLNELPTETIHMLVDVLSEYLEERE